MNSKLTLSLDLKVIEVAKAYAKSQQRSLSSIVEAYLKSLTGPSNPSNKSPKSKLIRELKGSVRLPTDDKTYKQLLEDALVAKYLT